MAMAFLIPACPSWAEDPTKDFSAYIKYLTARDKVLSENIGNTDTPGYQPMELKRRAKEDSGFMMKKTNTGHMDIDGDAGVGERIKGEVIEIKPNGNKVNAEFELFKKSENSMRLQEAMHLQSKFRAMHKIAITGGK
jgi:flagellar basal-body rod protein FlgB